MSDIGLALFYESKPARSKSFTSVKISSSFIIMHLLQCQYNHKHVGDWLGLNPSHNVTNSNYQNIWITHISFLMFSMYLVYDFSS